MSDRIDLILKIVEGIKDNNESEHKKIFDEIATTRKEVNGLKEFKNKVLGMATILAVIVSTIFTIIVDWFRRSK